MSQQKKIMSKIAKCLALAESNNPHEAGRALAQAKKLMEMHGINQSDLDMASVNDATLTVTKAKKIPKHLRFLMGIMGHVFGVKVISTQGQGGSAAQFIGFGEAPEIASYAYEVLAAQLKRDRKDYLRSLDRDLPSSRKTRLADLFCRAWANSVYEKVEALKAEIERSDLIDKWVERQYEEVRTLQTRPTVLRSEDEEQAVNDGLETGKGANLFHGMQESPEPAMLTSD